MNALISTVRAVMAWRILVNFRARPDAVAQMLPSPFRPKLVGGRAIAGICLIRLEEMRPACLPRAFGVASVNAAHRIAVEWNENGRSREGVFIPRRDTNSLLNRLAGGRFFPGIHHPAKVRCVTTGERFDVELRSKDRETFVKIVARLDGSWPAGSVFKSLDEASAFFRNGGCGWSPSNNRALEGVELHAQNWMMHPLTVEQAESSFFGDARRFPRGSVEFDSALLMRGITHEWRALGRFGQSPTPAAPSHHGPAAVFELP